MLTSIKCMYLMATFETKMKIHLKEVFENATVIYLVLELVTGGELFERFAYDMRLHDKKTKTFNFQSCIVWILQ